jgi:hypothetical protein
LRSSSRPTRRCTRTAISLRCIAAGELGVGLPARTRILHALFGFGGLPQVWILVKSASGQLIG